MGNLTSTPLLGKQKEVIHIKKTGGKVDACLRVYKYIDKDTKHFVAYIPSLEISGYGYTKENALEMMESSLEEYFDFLLSLTGKKLEIELSKFGWKHDKLKNKDYSKSYVDISGNLKDFAVTNSVEQEMLETA